MKGDKHSKGQYFTTNEMLKHNVYELIQNDPDIILEPSIGQGDLVDFVKRKKNVDFHCYEIDENIKLLDGISYRVVYGDFLEQSIDTKYKTIIGNPPYVKTKTGNLYVDFTRRCFELLEENGELVFIVPSDFIKITSANRLISEMLCHGTFTHIIKPNDEKLFTNASIDIIIFRYCKDKNLPHKTLINNIELNLINTSGILTFSSDILTNQVKLEEYFDIFVGMVSGKESVFKNSQFGNIEILNGNGKNDKYIMLNKFPSSNDELNRYLNTHKEELISRRIKKFTETNWWDWGAKRNINNIIKNYGKQCIYVTILSRKKDIAFTGTVQYFGGGLIQLIPKVNVDLDKMVNYFNSAEFQKNYLYSGRIKLGHKQLCNSLIEK